MKPQFCIIHGDCLDVVSRFEPESVDAIVTDPPYGLEFMGKEWDAPWKFGLTSFGYSDGAERRASPSFKSSRNPTCVQCGRRQRTWKSGPPACACARPRWDREQSDEMALFQMWAQVWAEVVLRAAKPGAHLAAFGGTRTFHRQTCAIEDAGWEIRDHLSWLYGQGFPKSKNIEGGRGTALKPAWEPIALARKGLVGTLEKNADAHGTGAMNIDACRIDVSDQKGGKSYAGYTNREPGQNRQDVGVGFAQRSGDPQDGKGRWPANVALDEEAAMLLDEQTGVLKSGSSAGFVGEVAQSVALGDKRAMIRPESIYADSGGASRFFYCAKASSSERTHGGQVENKHPTVKPLALMRWLCRLITPAGALVLDPFMGSGSTGVAALQEGFWFVGIEKDEESVKTARARMLSAGFEEV